VWLSSDERFNAASYPGAGAILVMGIIAATAGGVSNGQRAVVHRGSMFASETTAVVMDSAIVAPIVAVPVVKVTRYAVGTPQSMLRPASRTDQTGP
jgi:hypothetical protein